MASIRSRVKDLVPPGLLNGTLLRFPRLYRTSLVNYETNLSPAGVEDLLGQLDRALAVPGDVVECGSSRCGSAVLMARRLLARGEDRRILACDSFEGFDLDELGREREAGLTESADDSFTSTSLDYVRRKLAALRVDDVVQPVPGYFEDTLADLDGPFCLAFIDCDLRDSLLLCARELWDGLSPGGRMVFDDYLSPDYRGARDGVDAFAGERSADIAEHGVLDRLYYLVKQP